ncbi:uncharacterized protein LOC114029535 isoform X2 [Vombatus ursinus]|uniref:uncharacterized protein LOC114029533 isoform X2 n=1 Tax=Vombatus ursinus TaxID=29139 RepID=UPI000FFD3587|nr:uncharacterized protein LOC114029533 isoform X2 [Vombatus ursinus]XP_027699821.1 uncharacterized protein LOC114029535 isoform X2 [Vombatus ursinus]
MGRKKKTLHDYAAEFTDLGVKRHVIEHSESGGTSVVETLYCKSCELPMRVRRDRILEHLSSGRHYRNRHRMKQRGGQTPIFISAASDLSSHLPVQVDPPPALLSQPPYVFPGVPCLTSTSASMVPSPPSYHRALLPAHLSAISSTTSAVPVREDQTPSTSTNHPSAFTTLHVKSPAVPSEQNSQRLIVSEASSSVASGSGVGWLLSDGALGSSLGLALFGVGSGNKALFQSLVEEDSCCLLYVVEDQLSDVEQAFRSDHLVNTRVLREQDANIVLNDQRVSGVIICSPPEAASEIVMGALRAGKGVFCEKLPSLDRQIAEMCFDEANRCGKPLVCGFYKRFDPALQFLYQKVGESRALGRIHRIAVVSSIYPPASPSLLRKSGGIFYNAAVHDVDIVSLLLGESVPDTVFSLGHAFCSDVASLKDADSVMVSMKFPSGAIVSLDISQHCTKSCDLRVEAQNLEKVCFPMRLLLSVLQRSLRLADFLGVHGSQGTLRVDNQNPLGITERGTSVSIYSHTHVDRYQEAYRGLFRHFLRTLKGKEPPTVPKEQFLWTIQVAAAAEQSWRNGSAVDFSNEG